MDPPESSNHTNASLWFEHRCFVLTMGLGRWRLVINVRINSINIFSVRELLGFERGRK